MIPVFKETSSLDQRCYQELALNEDILMENAAQGIATHIKKKFPLGSSLLILAGSGNNGADGIALARILHGAYKVELFLITKPKTPIGKKQLTRAKKAGVKIIKNIKNSYTIVVEAIFGSGFNRDLEPHIAELITLLNSLESYKIACDIPTPGFKANSTLTMGALKEILFCDHMKDYVGKIKIIDLGVSSSIYTIQSECFLLEKIDITLPNRYKKMTNKGTFGHLCVVIGDKEGAGLIACEAAFAFGVGLVSALGSKHNLPVHIMNTDTIPANTTAIAIGMGLGEKDHFNLLLNNDLPKLLDAEILENPYIIDILKRGNCVLTPHPKEFCKLWKMCGFVPITIEMLQKNRFFYVRTFYEKFPKSVIVLKGANTLICGENKIFINTFGTPRLSFGGSGDVLSGLIGSLLAQKYSPLQSAITATLAHTLAAIRWNGADFTLTPIDLINQIKFLKQGK